MKRKVKKRKPGRPRGSGLGKYAGRKAKHPASLRKWWREEKRKRAKKKKRS